MKKLISMKRREIISIEIMKSMKIRTITSIIMLQDQNTKELQLLLRQKFLVSHPRKRERSNQIKLISTRK